MAAPLPKTPTDLTPNQGESSASESVGARTASAPARPRGFQRVIFAMLPVCVLLAMAEAGSRVYYVAKHGGGGLAQWLHPFGVRRLATAEYRYRASGAYTEFDACTQREVAFSVNRWGGRGPDWPAGPPPGRTIRILAVGGSMTFGVNNPESATWPVLLQQELSHRGVTAEVLNLSAPSKRLEQIVDELPEALARWSPRIVLYYEGVNNATAQATGYFAADTAIGRFHHEHVLGRLASSLHYRSVLYTLLLEKLQFMQMARKDQVVPEIDYFRKALARFIRLVRAHGATPVLVLQVTQSPPDPELRTLHLDDHRAVEAAIRKAVDADTTVVDTRYSTRLWTYQAQVLVEVVRRTGEAQGVQVIDPRPAFATLPNSAALFCDMVHLRDEGNAVLAGAIGHALDLKSAR